MTNRSEIVLSGCFWMLLLAEQRHSVAPFRPERGATPDCWRVGGAHNAGSFGARRLPRAASKAGAASPSDHLKAIPRPRRASTRRCLSLMESDILNHVCKCLWRFQKVRHSLCAKVVMHGVCQWTEWISCHRLNMVSRKPCKWFLYRREGYH